MVGEVLGVWFSWNFMAKKFKTMTDQYNSITITDFLVSHFRSNTNFLRFISATALSLFVVIYVSAQIDITGKTFESFLGLNYYIGIAIGFGIVVFYILSGGFIAVAWSDFFQGALMFVGLLILPPVIFYSLNDSDSIIKGLGEIDPGLLNLWGFGGFNLMNFFTVLGLLSIGIGFMGSPQVYVRFIAISNTIEIEKGKWVAIFYTFLTDSSAVLIGILARYMFTKKGYNPELVLGVGGEEVLSLAIGQVMPSIIVGVYIAAVLSAVMSTIDSLLVVASSAVTRDLYQKIIRPDISERSLIKISKRVTFFLAFLALLVALAVSALSPTRTYLPVMKSIFSNSDRKKINVIIHCTGGGQTKVLHFIKNMHIIKDNLFETPDIFNLISKESRIDFSEMYSVFNMGHRMEFYTDKNTAKEIIQVAKSFNIDAKIIGKCVSFPEKKLTIKSQHGEFVY